MLQSSIEKCFKQVSPHSYDYIFVCETSFRYIFLLLYSAIRVFLWSIGKYFVSTRESSRNKLYTRSFIMSNRHSYQQWSKENGHDLKRLLHVPVETIVDSSVGVHGIDAVDPLDWSEGSLIKSEILLRVVLRAASETSLNVHKHTWSTLFELLLWARSRGSLPHELAKISNSFSFYSVESSTSNEGSWKGSSAHCNSYRPSSFARSCYMQAFGLQPSVASLPNTAASLEGINLLETTSSKTNSGSSWISFLWSSGMEESDSAATGSRQQPPLSALLMQSALANDSFEVFSNANASIHLDNKGHHIRTDDHFLQLTIEKCSLEQLFQSLLFEANSKRGETLYAGCLLTLSRLLGKLVGQQHSFDAIEWNDTFENRLFEGNIPLADIFPTYLLNDEELEFHTNPAELDVVICLEWIGNFTFLNEKTWSKFSGKLKGK